MAAWSLDRVHGTIADACGDVSVLHGYLWFRLVLGCFQIVAHMGVLCPARLSERCGRCVTVRLGGRTTFYRYLTYCNYAIFVVLVASLFMLARMSNCDLAQHSSTQSSPSAMESILVLEVFSAFLLGAVLAVRIAAIRSNQVQEWFFLKWGPLPDVAPDHPSGAPTIVSGPTTEAKPGDLDPVAPGLAGGALAPTARGTLHRTALDVGAVTMSVRSPSPLPAGGPATPAGRCPYDDPRAPLCS